MKRIYSGGLHSGNGFSLRTCARFIACSSRGICLDFNVRNKFNLSSSRLIIELNVGILNSLNKAKGEITKDYIFEFLLPFCSFIFS